MFENVQLTLADLPQPPAPSVVNNTGVGGGLEFYGPGNSGSVASPNSNTHAEISPVFGGEGPG
jgi:hypothetical protein